MFLHFICVVIATVYIGFVTNITITTTISVTTGPEVSNKVLLHHADTSQFISTKANTNKRLLDESLTVFSTNV